MIVSVAILTGCIDNDIPYPTIVPQIETFTVDGQIGETQYDIRNRLVMIEVEETVDLRSAKVLEFAVSDDAVVTPGMGDTIDLTTPRQYTLTTYQNYVWTIQAAQNIERYVTGDKLVNTVFDPVNKSLLIYVQESQALDDITLTSLKLGPTGSIITPDVTTVHDFRQPVTFTVEYYGDIVEKWKVTAVYPTEEISVSEANAWAMFADVAGLYAGDDGQPTFEYRVQGTTEWRQVAFTDVTTNMGNFSARINGLTPQTTYEYRAVAGDVASSTATFTTESAAQIPNSNFDDWFTLRENKPTYYAALEDDYYNNTYWWDSGNTGANTLGPLDGRNPTSPESSVVVSGKAAKLQNMLVANVLASGSIYTGRYGSTLGLSAILYFGRPYSSRPLRMTGYYNYSPGIIDKTHDSHKHLEGEYDHCHIYVVLTDRNEPYTINTSTKEFIDFEFDTDIIAFGELKSNANSNGYQPFTIDIEYRSLTRTPKYVVVVASASELGDWFTGSTSSLLYIDEFNFEFE